MDEKKEEGCCSSDCKCGCRSGGKCRCCGGKAALALVLLLIGALIGYGAGKCRKMCPMGGMMNPPAATTTQVPAK